MNRFSRTRAFGVRQPCWVQHKSLPSHILRRKQGQLSWQKRPFTPGSDGERILNMRVILQDTLSADSKWHIACGASATKWDGCHHLLSQKHGETPPTTYSGHLCGDWRLASGAMSWRMFDWNVVDTTASPTPWITTRPSQGDAAITNQSHPHL